MSNTSSTGSPVGRRAVLAALGGTGLAAVLSACSGSPAGRPTREPDSGRSGTSRSSSGGTTASTPPTTTPPSTSASSARSTAKRVKVHSFLDDGATVGVGMPVILSFDPTPTDSRAFIDAAEVTVDGKPVDGAWFWIKRLSDAPIEAHFRTTKYWPPNATVKVNLPIGGLSAGRGLVYRDDLSSVTFRTGDERITTVDGRTLRAKVRVNGKKVRTMKVSLGAADTRTFDGIKLVMQKGEADASTGRMRPDGEVRMRNTAGDYDEIVPWSVRVTQSGEYLHAASWNGQIGRLSTSNGCTNLSPDDAQWFYRTSTVGDIVVHRNTGGELVRQWDGYSDWNISWPVWSAGGAIRTK